MADTKNDENSKVMDVAKPGQAKPETGSKPMVVGHKSLMTDPDMKAEQDSSHAAIDTAKDTSEQTLSTKSKITLQPVSEDMKTKTPQTEETTDTTKDEPAESANPEEPTADTQNVDEVDKSPSESESPQEAAEKAASDAEQAKLEQEARLDEIIKSKEYYVPIKAHRSTAAKTFILTFLFVCLLGVFLLALLIDADILDAGIELPFDFL